jgi:hypothetical protein
MADWLGVYQPGDTIPFTWTTYAKAGGNIAPSAAFVAGDLDVLKAGVARGSSTGYTVTSPLGGVTGRHHVELNTGNNTVAGFYSDNTTFEIVDNATSTVDGETVKPVLARFRIQTTPTTAQLVQAMWDALTSALTTAGSIGKLIVDNLNGTILSRQPSSGNAPADVAVAVVDQALSGHTTSGTVGGALNSASSAGDPWSTALPGSYASGTAGYILAGISTVLSGITALRHWLGLLAGKQAANSTALTEIRNSGAGSGTFDPTTDSLEANRDAALTAAQVNAEVVDALTVDVLADSVSTDGSRPTIGQAVLEINRFLKERSLSGTTLAVKKEDGTTTSMTFTVNDATSPTSITRAS